MASAIPNVPGTGSKIPVATYIAGITESYPNVNRKRLVEASINSKERVDFMPCNMSVNQVLTDRYIEFRVNGVVGSFIDMSSISLELMLKISVGGQNLGANNNIGFVNGLCNTLFKSVNVFLNDKMIESNSLHNYCSYVKQLKMIKTNFINSIGKCAFLYDDSQGTGIKDMYIARNFTDQTSLETKLMSSIKSHGIHLCFPLLLDLSSLDMYLMDSVDLRIRLEMASNNWIINANEGGGDYNLSIDLARLWLDRVTPHYSAMIALNNALTLNPVQYIFNKTLHKTYVIGQNQSSIMIDQPFGNCIPDKLSMLMVDMRSFAGDYIRNGLYFKHCDLSNIHITINGSTVYNINCGFPNKMAQVYYEMQKAIGLERDNLISYDAFHSGRAVFYFNFVSEDMQEALPVEMSASMRINLKFSTPVNSNTVIILFAETIGLMTIDADRTVLCDVRG